jgi:signal transduction histidine kinase
VQDESDILLVVEDDGAGFDPELLHDERHFGLELMKERARVLGGVIELRSSPGCGTTVTARLGLKSAG